MQTLAIIVKEFDRGTRDNIRNMYQVFDIRKSEINQKLHDAGMLSYKFQILLTAQELPTSSSHPALMALSLATIAFGLTTLQEIVVAARSFSQSLSMFSVLSHVLLIVQLLQLGR